MLAKQKKVFAVPCDPARMQKAARMQKDFYLAWGGWVTLTRAPVMKLGRSPVPPCRMVFLIPSTFRSRVASMALGAGRCPAGLR